MSRLISDLILSADITVYPIKPAASIIITVSRILRGPSLFVNRESTSSFGESTVRHEHRFFVPRARSSPRWINLTVSTSLSRRCRFGNKKKSGQQWRVVRERTPYIGSSRWPIVVWWTEISAFQRAGNRHQGSDGECPGISSSSNYFEVSKISFSDNSDKTESRDTPGTAAWLRWYDHHVPRRNARPRQGRSW